MGLGEYQISVNAESKEAQHDNIARKILDRQLRDDYSTEKYYLEHGEDEAEELAKEPVVDKQDK